MTDKVNCTVGCPYFVNLSAPGARKEGRCVFNPPSPLPLGADKFGRPLSMAFFPGVNMLDVCSKHPQFDHTVKLAGLGAEEEQAPQPALTASLLNGSAPPKTPIPDNISAMIDQAAHEKKN